MPISSVILDGKVGLITGGRKENYIRFSVDTVIPANCVKLLESIITKSEEAVKEHGMNNNVEKTSVMRN